MTAQFLPIFMGLVATMATILKFRAQGKASVHGRPVRQSELKVEDGLVTVSGVTISQLQTIANALAHQQSEHQSDRGVLAK